MMEEEEKQNEFTKNYSEELRNGIFNLSVSMCQHLSQFVPMEQAKEETAKWLDSISAGLRTISKNPLESK
jgi:hypothetical protein